MQFRELVAKEGLGAAYGAIDVIAAGSCEFTDQGQIWLSLGPCDPPLRLRQALLGGVAASGGYGPSELCLPIGAGLEHPKRRGGAHVLDQLLAGEEVPLELQGEATTLHPRRELQSQLQLKQLGAARLLLSRAISENGVVAVSSAEGLLPSPIGGLLGPFGNALFNCSGARSIGLTMPGLSQLGPGQPLLIAGSIGHVLGPGSGHQPCCRRLPTGHAKAPGATVAASVNLKGLQRRWIKPCWFDGHGAGLLIAVAAPVLLLTEGHAHQAATPDSSLEAPVLDFSVPRRIRPGFGSVSYGSLLGGKIQVDSHIVKAAPACSLSLGDSHTALLSQQLSDGSFPIRAWEAPLAEDGSLHPIDP
jgi:uncharacterized protein (DUF39 family)